MPELITLLLSGLGAACGTLAMSYFTEKGTNAAIREDIGRITEEVKKVEVRVAEVTGYLSEKGRNAATKEDIGAITEEVKEVEARFSEALTRLTHDYGLFAKSRNDAYADLYSRLQVAIEATERHISPTLPLFTAMENDELKAIAASQYIKKHEREAYLLKFDTGDPTQIRVFDAEDMYRLRQQRRAAHAHERVQAAILKHALYLRGDIRILANELMTEASWLNQILSNWDKGPKPLAKTAGHNSECKRLGDRLVDLMQAEMEGFPPLAWP